jgi:hypothetical protein
LDSRINSEAPDRARERTIAQRSADTPHASSRRALITTVGDQRQLHQLPFHLKASADFGDIWHFGERVALYADAGTTVTVNVVRNQNPGNGFFHWTVSGYLTPAVRE